MSTSNLHQAVVNRRISIIPTGVAVKVDCNPIARYNHAIQQYQNACNMIDNIELSTICIPGAVSWLYDLIIYFYTLFFLTISCQSQTENGLCYAIIMTLIYVALLIAPIVSPIVFGISAIYFIYYCAGLIVYCVNTRRLQGHEFTEKMIHQSQAPPFPGYKNEYFSIQEESTIAYYNQNGLQTYYYEIKKNHKGSFMAYKNSFIDENYTYVRSAKMICFHLTFMILSIFGFIISVTTFGSAYGRN